MKDKKFQIFVSSTYTDLKEERQAAVEAILSAGHIPAGMELFTAGDESQMTVIKRWVDESDIYLLILGGRYGSIEPRSGKSYTHLEFEYALEIKKPYFSVVITKKGLEEKVVKLGRSALEDENPKLLKEFKGLATSNMVEFWDDKKDIQLAIFKTLSDFIYRKELIGWVKADNVVNTALVAEQIAKLTDENSMLKNNLEKSSKAFHFGLTYDEIEKLLKNKKFKYRNLDTNLIYFLYEHGYMFVNGIFSPVSELREIINQLIEFKILYSEYFENTFKYNFTSEGHDIYIKIKYEYKFLD